MPYGVSTSLLSLSLSSLCPVKFLTSLSSLSFYPLFLSSRLYLLSLPGDSISVPLFQLQLISLSSHFPEHTDVHTHTPPSSPSCHRSFRARSVRGLPVGMTSLPPSSSRSHVCLYFLFLFLTCLSSVQSALLGLRSIQQRQNKRLKKENYYKTIYFFNCVSS